MFVCMSPIPILLFRTLDKLLLHITAFSKEGRRLTAPQRHPRLLCNRIGRRVPLLQCYVAYKDDDGPHRTTFFSLSLSLLPAPTLVNVYKNMKDDQLLGRSVCWTDGGIFYMQKKQEKKNHFDNFQRGEIFMYRWIQTADAAGVAKRGWCRFI